MTGKEDAGQTGDRRESAGPGWPEGCQLRGPDTLLGTALNSQDGNEWPGHTIGQRGHRAAELAADGRRAPISEGIPSGGSC